MNDAALVRHVIGNNFHKNRLGRKPKDPNKKTLPLERYMALPDNAPASVDHYSQVGMTGWGMMLNDRIGDCTCAAMGHSRQLFTSETSKESTVPDHFILKAYSALSGYDPLTGANDNGCNPPDVLKYWQNTGIGYYRHKILGWAQFDHTNVTTLKNVIDIFGCAYLGIECDKAWVTGPEVWDAPSGRIDSDGGHAIIAAGYDDQYVYIVSWGQIFKMTWRAYSLCLDEAYAVIAPEWVEKSSGKTPGGLDLATLQADLANL